VRVNTPSSAASEAVFGSAARGDADHLSDRDYLILDDDKDVLSQRAKELEAEG
jgi:predicted nucleotidyltransferase